MRVNATAKIQAFLASILAFTHTTPSANICETKLPTKPGNRGSGCSFLPYFQKLKVGQLCLFYFSVPKDSTWIPFEKKNLCIFISEPTLNRNLLYLEFTSASQHYARFQTCIRLLRKTLISGQSPHTALQDYRSLQHAFRHWVFMLISLYKHFHIWTEPLRFVGRSKLKQKGRKNTMLCSKRGMEKPYWTVITKMDEDHSTEQYIYTIIKTLPVQNKGQYKDQYKDHSSAVTTTNYSQKSVALQWAAAILGISSPLTRPHLHTDTFLQHQQRNFTNLLPVSISVLIFSIQELCLENMLQHTVFLPHSRNYT